MKLNREQIERLENQLRENIASHYEAINTLRRLGNNITANREESDLPAVNQWRVRTVIQLKNETQQGLDRALNIQAEINQLAK